MSANRRESSSTRTRAAKRHTAGASSAAPRPSEAIAKRLRQLRRDRDWTLHDVERASGGAITASALGSYERQDRAVSMQKMQQLADFYQVPTAFLMGTDMGPVAASGMWSSARAPLRLKLDRLATSKELERIDEFVRRIQQERNDFGSSMITLRGGDLRLISHLMSCEPVDAIDSLAQNGIIDRPVKSEVSG